MTVAARLAIAMILVAALGVCGLALIQQGLYGWTLFVLLPIGIGALGAWLAESVTAGRSARNGMLSVVAVSVAILLVKIEGLLCIFMALPLILPLGALGGWLAYLVRVAESRTRPAAMLLLLPLATMTWDTTARPELFPVRTAVTIEAPPEQVWPHVIAFPDLAEPTEWFFRAGLAYPKRARIEGTGPEAIRYCEFSTGPFVEPITVWDEPRLLRFRVTENPMPMRELSPWGSFDAKHLHGYLVSRQGQFQLTRLSDGRTLLEGTTWYQHGLWPAQYWRWWSDAIIHRIHLRVLNHVKTLAEAGATSRSVAVP